MSRLGHFAIAICTLLLCGFWCILGVVVLMSYAAGKDVRGVPTGGIIGISVFFGIGVLFGLWFAYGQFRRAMKPKKVNAGDASVPQTSTKTACSLTPEEKLAPLVKQSPDKSSH